MPWHAPHRRRRADPSAHPAPWPAPPGTWPCRDRGTTGLATNPRWTPRPLRRPDRGDRPRAPTPAPWRPTVLSLPRATAPIAPARPWTDPTPARPVRPARPGAPCPALPARDALNHQDQIHLRTCERHYRVAPTTSADRTHHGPAPR